MLRAANFRGIALMASRKTLREDGCAPGEHTPAKRQPVLDDAAAARAAAIFRVLGDASRVRLIGLLMDGDRCVGDLASIAAAPMSTVSQQLRLLRAESIVGRRRVGKHVYYTLADPRVASWVRDAMRARQ